MSSTQENSWKSLLKEGEEHAGAGRVEQAEHCYLQAIDVAERDGGREDGELVTALMHLGDFYFGRKQLPKAQKVYERALEIYEKLQGDNVLTALCMRRLGEVYRGLGELPRAREMAERVEKIGYLD